jgi:hypothetical protein
MTLTIYSFFVVNAHKNLINFVFLNKFMFHESLKISDVWNGQLQFLQTFEL